MRNHVVLVPGFAGFDALGQIRYYSGVTSAYKQWKAAGQANQNAQRRSTLEMHYFDNLPTAAVSTRANRLRSFLAKRVARGSFQPGDQLTLVGHSTGGLDIRRLLFDLCLPQQQPICVDGDAVLPTHILELMSHIVFLSVPQYGTNIANWVKSHERERRFAIDLVSGFAAASLQRLPDIAFDLLAGVLAPNLRAAVKDAVREASTTLAGSDPIKLANAREAASDLKLWLENIDQDFTAIDDLRNLDSSGPSDANTATCSPAHFSQETRRLEKTFWENNSITTMSFATLGRSPYQYAHAAPGHVWNPFNVLDQYRLTVPGFDTTYVGAYLACASGGFSVNTGDQLLRDVHSGEVRSRYIEQWENDGIVNTASMLWPDEAETFLVHGDHADIVGHYELACVDDEGALRQHDRYDLFDSVEVPGRENFDDERFRAVWDRIFDFCIA